MTTGRRWGVIVGLVVVASSAGAFWHYQHQPQTEHRYRTQAVSHSDLVQSVSATGTLNPVRVVSIGTQVSGTVSKLYVDFNDKVKKGQVLLELDPQLTTAQLRQSEANLASAQAKLVVAEVNAKRLRDLFKQQYISRQELDQAESDFAAAKAQVALVQAQVDRDRVNKGYTVIRAPVDGVVTDRQIDLGQTVAASFQTPTLIKLAQDLTKMQIDANFAEADLGKLKEGLEVSFRVDAFPKKTWTGHVRQIRLNPTVQQNVVTYDVVIDVDNPEQLLLPGMTAYVDIALEHRDNALVVPNAALRFRPEDAKSTANATGGKGEGRRKGSGGHRDGMATVYVLANEQLKPIKIKTGITDGKQTEVLEGNLAEGTPLVTGDNQAKGNNGSNNMNPQNMRRF